MEEGLSLVLSGLQTIWALFWSRLQMIWVCWRGLGTAYLCAGQS